VKDRQSPNEEVRPSSKPWQNSKPQVWRSSGGWCWFQGERVLLTPDWLLFGSVDGVTGAVEVTAHHRQTGKSSTIPFYFPAEDWDRNDHLTPGLWQRPDHRFLAMYARHGRDHWNRYRISEPNDPTRWSEEFQNDSLDGHPGLEPIENVTYSNLLHLAREGCLYNFYRGRGWNPNFLISRDNGGTWAFGGRLLTTPESARPYLRYAGNGEDEVHFIATDGHPRNCPNSLYHGFLREGKLHRSDGTEIGPVGTDYHGTHPPASLTTIFPGHSEAIAWGSDIRLDPATGHPVVTYSVAHDPSFSGGKGLNHSFRYARWTGTKWEDHLLAPAGTCLYDGENEYTGLATLDPTDPNRIFFCTNVDPESGQPIEVEGAQRRELFEAVTVDGGTSWHYTRITLDSPADNLRPVVAVHENSKALLWMRGHYPSFIDYQTEIVGYLWEE